MYKKSITLFLLKLLKIPLSILTLSLTAKYFGVSLDRDVWLIGLMTIGMLGLAIWGPINETFRAKFVAIKELEGQESAIKYTKSLIFYMCIISLILVVVLFTFPHVIVKIVAPGFNEIAFDKLTRMIVFLSPILLFSQINLILSSILNAYEIYYIPEISSLATQLINIFIIIYFSSVLGIYALVLALYTSTLILCIFLYKNIIKLKIPLFKSPNVFNINGFKIFFAFSFPFFIPYLIGQLNGMFEKAIATSLGIGAVSILDFSKIIPDLLNGLLVSIVLTILVPNLSKSFINKDVETYNKQFLVSYRLGLFGLILFIVFFINGAEPVSYLIYKSDAINLEQMNKIILLSKLFSISLIAVFSYIIFGMSMLSSNKAKLYVVSGSVAQLLSIFLNYTMVKWFDIRVFPLTFFLVHFLAAVYMCMNYPYGKNEIYKETLRYYIFCALSTVCAYYLFLFLFGSEENLLIKILYSLFLTFLMVIVFGSLLKINEVNLLFKIIFDAFKRGK